MNYVAEFGFLIAAVAIIFVPLRRQRHLLSAKDRNAVVTATMGLMVCGRLSGLTHHAAELIWVVCVGMMMLLLAKSILKPAEQI